MSRLIASLSFIWLATAMSTMAQNPVLDSRGQALSTDAEYYILPAATDVAGGLTLIDRNDSCPFYVGQEPLAPVVSQGYPVKFAPYEAGETIVREGRDFAVSFSASTICVQSTFWRLGEEDPETNRRLIATGGQRGYFRIDNNGGLYYISWCPTESCPNCRPRCGTAGILIENGKRLLALDGSGFPFQFVKV